MNISVIVPSYNRERYIEKCLKSIIGQTFPPLEIIVVDDCSSDKTVEKAKSINSKLIRVIALEKNSGAQVARNRGVREAKGEWIAFCDSDDWWLPDKLEKQVSCISGSGRAICAGGAQVLRNGAYESKWLNGSSGMIFEKIISNKTYILFPTLLVRKDCLINIDMLDERVKAYQEWDTAIRLSKIYEIDYINEPLFVYNIHDNETISKDKKRAIEGKRYIFNKYKITVKEELGYSGMVYWYNLLASAYSLVDFRHWLNRGISITYFMLKIWKEINESGKSN